MRFGVLIVLAGVLSGCASPAVQRGELLSRTRHGSYDTATYSFEHALRDDPDHRITRNDWDLEFGNGADVFNVTMVTDDRSRIVDLGSYTWADLEDVAAPIPEAHPEPTREAPVAVIPGHVYVVHTVDSDTDLVALVRVETLVPGDRVTFTWRLY